MQNGAKLLEGASAPWLDRMIVRRKIIIPDVDERVSARPRLTEQLAACMSEHQLVRIVGTAGAGKTTAVVLALRALGRPAAWVSLDQSDSAPGRLLVYLEAAIEQALGGDRQNHHVATEALAANIPPPEAAGLLAQSVESSQMVIVCDNVERISNSEPAMAILTALAQYVPTGVNVLLLSRTSVPCGLSTPVDAAQLREQDLDFTTSEAAAALACIDVDADPAEVVRVTGGWVTGVLFGPWCTALSASSGAVQDRNSLNDYITANILHGLSSQEYEFLVRSSLLEEITADAASSLGLASAWKVMRRLRTRHLPAVWSDSGRVLRPHPQFREHLRELLSLESPHLLSALKRRLVPLLLERSEVEEAIGVLLELGEVAEARMHVWHILPALVERMDFALAASWLDTVGWLNDDQDLCVDSAIMRVAFALERFEVGAEYFSRRDPTWLHDLAECESGETLALLTWCLWHCGQLTDAQRVVSLMTDGWPREVAKALLALSADTATDSLPAYPTVPSGPLDGLHMRTAYMRGRLANVEEVGSHGDPWRTTYGAPWVIAGLKATGRIDQAMSLYELHIDQQHPLWLHAIDAIELMMDLGRGEEALRRLEHGRSLIAGTCSRVYRMLNLLVEAKLHLRLNRDWRMAEVALGRIDNQGAADYAFICEQRALWRGLSLLLQDRAGEARTELRSAVESMLRNDRRLDITTACVYLAEAEWRVGSEDLADAAAELALSEAARQGSRHLLLQALGDVPDVASRSSDAEPSRTSRWHELNALLTNAREVQITVRRPRLVVEEFGIPSVFADGREVRVRLSKSVELLAYLISKQDRSATRIELLNEIFGGRSDPAGRSYLRQAIYRLRSVLPDGLAPEHSADELRFERPDVVSATGDAVLRTLSQADHQDGKTRLDTIVGALGIAERGRYLATLSTPWVDARRQEIENRLTSARLDAAKLLFRAGDYREAQAYVDRVLSDDPYREQAWRLTLNLAHAAGDDDALLARFRRYAATINELGIPPSDDVRELVARLRT